MLACSHWTWRLDPPPPFKKNNINPWDWGAPFHFCGFSKTKLVRKLSSTCLHDRNYMHYQQRHFINFILHLYFVPKLVFLFKPDFFFIIHYIHLTFLLHVVITWLWHTHLHKFLSICGWTWKLIANRGCFCSAQFMCNIESHFKKKILFHKRWLCSIHKLKG